MPKTTPLRPTDAELTLLRVIWASGPATVREIHEHLGPEQSVGYTTVLKLLQIMTEKGLVVRDESQRAHVYSAAVPEESTKRQLVGDLVQRAFGGSALQLVMSALSEQKSTPGELAEIRKIIDLMDSGKETR